MLTLKHAQVPCAYCDRGLMPVKSIEWDTRKYHKKCFKKIKNLEEMTRMYNIRLEEEKRYNQIRAKLGIFIVD